ncbi:MAG: hypothetical protein Q7J35_19245 [Candidatus Methanoperedens sp.]|nr:hypothetical protein [Candidatus Methanoperedens sp.]
MSRMLFVTGNGESFKVMIDPATGKLDISKSPCDRIRMIKEIIRELQDKMKSAEVTKDSGFHNSPIMNIKQLPLPDTVKDFYIKRHCRSLSSPKRCYQGRTA